MIRVSAEEISIVHRPVPLRKSKRVQVGDIVHLFHRERRRRLWWRLLVGRGTLEAAFVMGLGYHQLVARLKTGAEVVLLSDVNSVKQIAYIRGSIGSFLKLDE